MLLLASITQLDASFRDWAASLGPLRENFLRLVLAGVAGGLVGIEREIRGAQAGFRTYLLVCVGSALVMIVSMQLALIHWQPLTSNGPGVNINIDPSRIAYGVMTGIGFLGAGLIIHNKGAVRGLTTAAALWCIAAVGLCVGEGMYTLCMLATLLVLGALWILDYIEEFFPKIRERTVTLRAPWKPGVVASAVERCRNAGLRVTDAYFDRTADPSCADIQVRVTYFRPQTYQRFERQIEADPDFQLMAAQEV